MPKKRHESWQSIISREDKETVLDMSLILRLASSMDKRPDPSIDSVKISLINNDITFKLIPKKRRDDLLLEKWNLKSCEELLKEMKGLNLIVI